MTAFGSRRLLTEYNRLYKETDEIYHALARHYGLSDCAFWVLYVLAEAQQALTQSEVRAALSLSKQTVNSALKGLETSGYITLQAAKEDRKRKLLCLTPEGRRFVEETTGRVVQMELRAFEQLTPEEGRLFLSLMQKHTRHLRTQADALLGE